MVDPYIESAPDLIRRTISRHSAMNRVGESEEVADAVAFLLSGESSFINGTTLLIGGGDATRLY
jgi:NAD(P)-dependent dehydrogenase (short-subunit alcohol dehydrogenase family)